MEKFGIGRKVTPGADPAVKVDTLILTMQTDDVDVLRLYQLLYERASNLKLRFDPLGQFDMQ